MYEELAVCKPYHVCSTHGGQERAAYSRGAGIVDFWELRYGCWKSIPGPLLEQPVLLTKPSL